ncbi:hypothetical protein O3603_10560, partial [Prevotella sp. 20925_1_30]
GGKGKKNKLNGQGKRKKKASTIAPTSLTPDPSPNGEGSRKYCLLGIYSYEGGEEMYHWNYVFCIRLKDKYLLFKRTQITNADYTL